MQRVGMTRYSACMLRILPATLSGVKTHEPDARQGSSGAGRGPPTGYTRWMSPFRRLLAYMLRYRRAFLLGLICSIVTTLVTLLAPVVLQHAIDDLSVDVTRLKLLLYGVLLLGIGVIGGVFRFWTRRILIGASRDLEY